MSVRPQLAAVLIDVPDAAFDTAVRFWAQALGATPDPMPDMPGGDAAYVHLVGAAAVTDVLIQRTDDDHARFHLDVAVPDRAAAVDRAVALGGRVLQREDRWDIVADPAGLLLCLGFEGEPDPPRTSSTPADRGYLDAVFVDVPTGDVDDEVAFWAAVLDATPRDPGKASDAGDPYRELDGARAVGGTPVVVEVQAVGVDHDRDGAAAAPRFHVDLRANDVAAEVGRLEQLGAHRVAEVDDWITLADPVGNLLCVVPHGEGAT